MAYWSDMTPQDTLQADKSVVAANDPFDLAVIGGGINGAGVARDAAGRGARVLLLERGDLAQGTSSASSKLIHGGLRYLEHYEFALVREALSEREVLWKIAPHIIWPMRFILPHQQGLRPRWLLRLGLFLYDHIGGRRKLPATTSVKLARHPAGEPLKASFVNGFEYSDGWVDDARLVVLNARDAADRGAIVHTRREVTALTREGALWHIETATGERFRARAVVNAAGPAVLRLLDRAAVPTSRRMRYVGGSHIVVNKLFDHPYAYFFQLPDGRIFFAIPYERDFTLIGTTDREFSDLPESVAASEEEIAYLCEGANRYFSQKLAPGDVVWSYAGVRPLLDDGTGRPEAATRGYEMDVDGGEGIAPILSIFGGKITSYRQVAAHAVDKLAEYLPALKGKPWTADQPLPGGDFPRDGAAGLRADLADRFPFLTPAEVDRIAKAYGTLAQQWLGDAKGWSDLGDHFGHGLSAAEVDYLTMHEWARTSADILWRRSKLGLHFTPAQVAELDAYLANQENSA